LTDAEESIERARHVASAWHRGLSYDGRRQEFRGCLSERGSHENNHRRNISGSAVRLYETIAYRFFIGESGVCEARSVRNADVVVDERFIGVDQSGARQSRSERVEAGLPG
jgi:hypothetical protein